MIGGKQGFKKNPDAAKSKEAERLIGKLQMEIEFRKKERVDQTPSGQITETLKQETSLRYWTRKEGGKI